jgi:alpha-beta hydrolase superfamily lysophospholipase
MTTTLAPLSPLAEAADPAVVAASATTERWDPPPAGPGPRGTVIVLAGRGETTAVYGRFGRRLSADAYRVVAVAGPDPDAAVAAVLAEPALVRPVAVVGSDTGVWAARRIADAHPDVVDAVVLAGLPAATAIAAPADAAAEIAARTACSTHQRVLGQSARTGLFGGAPLGGLAATLQRAAQPVLALHGDADTLSPLADALPRYATLGATEVTAFRNGRHDTLNDACHRSVAATIVVFLETVRQGQPIRHTYPVSPS